MTPPEDHNNLSVTDTKGMEICDLPSKDFKIAVLSYQKISQQKHSRPGE